MGDVVLVLQLLVEFELPQPGPDALEVGDEVSDLLDGVGLLVKELALDEVVHLGILVGGGNLVKVKQTLVDVLLKSQGDLHGVQTATPLVTFGLLDVLQNDPATARVLEGHEFLGVFALLLAVLTEELGESGECHVIAVEVERH